VQRHYHDQYAVCLSRWASPRSMHSRKQAPCRERLRGAHQRQPSQPERQKQAIDALSSMGRYLRSLSRFEVRTTSATDAVLDSGQTVAFLHETDLKVERPNRMRADIAEPWFEGADLRRQDIHHLQYGGRLLLKEPRADTIDLLVRELSTTYNIDTPLADLFYWGNGKVDDVTLTSALFIGLERVDTRWCNHYAYQQKGADWELWIQSGTRQLPCRMEIIRYNPGRSSATRRDLSLDAQSGFFRVDLYFPACGECESYRAEACYAYAVRGERMMSRTNNLRLLVLPVSFLRRR